MTEALEWLEAHRGKPLTTDWYVELDAEDLAKLAQQGINPAEIEEAAPMPAEVQPDPGREGAWLVIYSPSLTRILDRRDIAAARVVDKRRLVIEYGKRRFVLAERDDG